MRKLAVAFVLALTVVAPASAGVRESCTPAGPQAEAVCYGADVVQRDAEAYTQPGRFEAAIRKYERSWTHRALQFQYELAGDLPFVNTPWPGTHNSFNSIAQQGPALATTDSNQQLTLVDQLRMDMRSLELDAHWFPSVRAGGRSAPVVCHAGAASDHDGCSVEPLLGDVLAQVRGWLDANRDQVLLLYIEDHLAGGYPATAQVIKETLGSRVYGTGSAGDCVEVPADLTRNDVVDAGAQVIIVANSGCGQGAAWNALAFSWRNHIEDGPGDFTAFPGCGRSRSDYDTRLVRFFEDSTWLSAGAAAAANESMGDGLTPQITREMTRCGVDLFGFDQLVPGDGRNEALVWSWAPGQPQSGRKRDCSEMRGDGRWYSLSCNTKRAAACRKADGSWVVSAARVRAADAADECASLGAVADVPRTGYDNESLKSRAAGERVWIEVDPAGRGRS